MMQEKWFCLSAIRKYSTHVFAVSVKPCFGKCISHAIIGIARGTCPILLKVGEDMWTQEELEGGRKDVDKGEGRGQETQLVPLKPNSWLYASASNVNFS